MVHFSKIKKPAQVYPERALLNNPGGFLLSHAVARAVPSAPRGLTSVFGMGTGVTLSTQPPENLFDFGLRIADCEIRIRNPDLRKNLFGSGDLALSVQAFTGRTSGPRVRATELESNSDQGKSVRCLKVFTALEFENSEFQIQDALLANKFYGQAKGLISTGQLSTLLRLHFQPINLVVYQESRGQD